MESKVLMGSREEEEMQELYSRYANFMEGYSIFSSQPIYIPFYKVKIRLSYTATTEMSLIEEFICHVIALDITCKEEIMDVLTLPEDIFNPVIESLMSTGILNTLNNREYTFADKGEELFAAKRKYEKREDLINWYYDGVSEGFKMDYFSPDEEHTLYSLNDISETDVSYILPPRIVPESLHKQDDNKFNELIIGKLRNDNRILAQKLPIHLDEIVSVEKFRIIPQKELLYHKYYLLLYSDGYENYTLLAHDSCGKLGIQSKVTEMLDELLSREFLTPSIQQALDTVVSMDKIILGLEESTNEDNIIGYEEERSAKIQALEKLRQTHFTLKYVMDYEIRKIFLEAISSAQSSLYIISPWMNDYIINDKFKKNLIRLLKQGAEIKILYGIDSTGQRNDSRSEKTHQIAEQLKQMAAPFGEQLEMIFGKTHEKVVIWDNETAMIGSYNFLSYGAEDTRDQRHEGCIYTNNKEIINEIINLRFKSQK